LQARTESRCRPQVSDAALAGTDIALCRRISVRTAFSLGGRNHSRHNLHKVIPMRNNDSRAAVRLELTDPLLTDVENWRRSQTKIPARATAVRLLVELAINSKAASENRAPSKEPAAAA
jgi:hypothetical protein